MTFEAQSAAFIADEDVTCTTTAAATSRPLFFPACEDVSDPDGEWAMRNPDRLMAFLFVSPRDCDAIDTVMPA